MEILLTADDLATIFRIDRQAVYRFAREGVLPHVRIGERKIRFPQGAVQKFIEEQLNKSKAQNHDQSLATAA